MVNIVRHTELMPTDGKELGVAQPWYPYLIPSKIYYLATMFHYKC